MKLEKKFYVASDSVMVERANWRHATLQEAIDHAAKLLEKEHYKSEKWIVQIVRVVKRKATPIAVTKVV